MAHHQHQHHQSTQQQTASKVQAPPALDWLSFPAPTVVDAPHPDLFDSLLDNSLSAYDQLQVQSLTLDYNTNAEAFQFYRSETPQGPPSVITASSESAYETLSQHSESLYNYSNPSPSQYGVDPSYTTDLGIDFSAFNVQSTADMAVLSSLLDHHETLSSYSAGGRYDMSATRSTYSASAGSYGPAGTGAIAPQHTSMPRAPSADSPKSPDSALTGEGDSRKKYACPDCSRSFARAYNLKTHRATHDPHRLKPYVCPHRNCGRSFSRKHDLGRHLVSIHRDDTGSQYSVGGHSTASERSHHVGLSAEKAVRTWCDNCGRSLVGAQRTCNCNDVK